MELLSLYGTKKVTNCSWRTVWDEFYYILHWDTGKPYQLTFYHIYPLCFSVFFAKELKQAQINQIHQYGKTTGQITGTVFHCSGCSSFKARPLWCLYCNPLPQNLQLPFELFSTMKQQCECKFRTRVTHKQ